MAKIREFVYSHNEDGSNKHVQYLYNCKGCGYEHAFGMQNHTWNNDYNNPTISPSLLQNFSPDRICHSFIVNGMIQYLGDCHHELRGQTIELPEYPEVCI